MSIDEKSLELVSDALRLLSDKLESVGKHKEASVLRKVAYSSADIAENNSRSQMFFNDKFPDQAPKKLSPEEWKKKKEAWEASPEYKDKMKNLYADVLKAEIMNKSDLKAQAEKLRIEEISRIADLADAEANKASTPEAKLGLKSTIESLFHSTDIKDKIKLSILKAHKNPIIRDLMKIVNDAKSVAKGIKEDYDDRSYWNKIQKGHVSDLEKAASDLDSLGYFKCADLALELVSRLKSATAYEIAYNEEGEEEVIESEPNPETNKKIHQVEPNNGMNIGDIDSLDSSPKVTIIKRPNPGNAGVLPNILKNLAVLKSAQKLEVAYDLALSSGNTKVAGHIGSLMVRTASSISQPYLLKSFEEKFEDSSDTDSGALIKKYTDMVGAFKDVLEKTISKVKEYETGTELHRLVDNSMKDYDANPKMEETNAKKLVKSIAGLIKHMDTQVQAVFNQYNK